MDGVSQVSCLEGHVPTADAAYDAAQEKCDSTAASSVDVQATITWMEEQKELCKPIDVDVKDAKRRISVAKGPKKRRNKTADGSAGESSADEST